VYHDLLGMMQHPHHAKVTPKFCKPFGRVGEEINRALSDFRDEVTAGAFPGEAFSPYTFVAGEEARLREALGMPGAEARVDSDGKRGS